MENVKFASGTVEPVSASVLTTWRWVSSVLSMTENCLVVPLTSWSAPICQSSTWSKPSGTVDSTSWMV